MRYQNIQVEPLTNVIGAEVRGVDLSKPLDGITRQEIHDAWMEHLVLFFRDQDLDIESHKAFARQFGELHIHPVLQPLKDEGHPEIVILVSSADMPYVAERWHSDVTFESTPPTGSILRALEIPEVGGDTIWASMYAAYEALSDSMQRIVSGLEAVHDPKYFRGIAAKQNNDAFEDKPDTVHPVIRTHPVTGRKGIFVNETFTSHIVGMKPKESQVILGYLYHHLTQPDFTCRFRWQKGSVAMWDNRCTQHVVMTDNIAPRRLLHRATLVGYDKPHC